MPRSLSHIAHDLIFSDKSQSLCARAYERRGTSSFWALWVMVFGDRHCRASWLWHNRRERK